MTAGLASVGGTPRKLLSLAKYSDIASFSHSFLCIESGDLQSEYERAGALVGIIGSASPAAIVRAAIQLAKKIRPNVICTHFTRSFICGTVVAKILQIPLIHNEHGPAVIGLEDGSTANRIGRALRGFWLPAAKAIICNSEYTGQTIVDAYGVDKSLLRVIHNPVEPRGFRSMSHVVVGQSYFPADSPLRIGHIGGMTAWRDQGTLIRAIGLLRDKGVSAQLILVGDGPQRDALVALTVELGLEQYISFWGYQTNLSEFFARIDIYVNPAVAEGFGIAVVEAMIEGVPVVLANAGAHPELIEDGRTGLLYSACNAQSLVSCIRRLTKNSLERLKIALAGRRHALHAFTPQRYASAYHDVVRSMLSKSLNSPHHV